MKDYNDNNTTMKRHTRLFEEFSQGQGAEVYLVLFDPSGSGSSAGHYEGEVVGVATSEQQADALVNAFRRNLEGTGWQVPSMADVGAGDVWVKRIDPTDREEVFYAFNGADASPYGDAFVEMMIEAGLDPTDFYDGDV